jgi:ribose transport system substrate-binding protein
MKIRGLLAVIGFLVATSVGAACSEAEDKSARQPAMDNPVTIAFFGPTGNTGFEASLKAARSSARPEKAEITVFNSGFDPQKQARQIQDAAASGRFDAFLVNAIDNVAVVPAVEDAIAAGVKVVAVHSAIGRDITTNEIQVEGLSGSVFHPPADRPLPMAKLVASACADEDPCEVVLMVGVLATGQERYMLTQVKEDLRSFPNIELVAEREGQWLPDPAFKAAQDVLQTHPDVDVFATTGDQMAVGVERAVKDANLTGEVKITGIGGSEIALKAIREGRWYGDIFPFLAEDSGRIATEIAIRAARGQKVERPVVDPNDETSVPYTMTQENKDDWADFNAQWQG